MTDPALFTKITIWLSLGLYFGCSVLLVHDVAKLSLYRLLWSVACLLYLIHVACAFQFHHSWSHELAFQDAARQTEAVVGWSFGAGVWFNYLFTAAWIMDVLRLWTGNNAIAQPRGWLGPFWRGAFLFIVFNATVIFEEGVVRWLGLLGCLSVVLCWWRR